MLEEYEKMLKNVPRFLTPMVLTDSPNSPIIIHEGKFEVHLEDKKFFFDGSISFRWFPIEGVYFKGNPGNWEAFSITGKDVDVFLNETLLGKAYITRFSQNEEIEVEGVFKRFCATGKPSAPVNRVKFAIPNLKEFHGFNIQEDMKFYSGRMEFQTPTYKLLIDKLPDYKERQNALKLSGGFHILYTGEINFTKAKNLSEVRKEISLVNAFLSFVSGREVSCLFFTGLVEDIEVWQDYSFYKNQSFRVSQSWSLGFIKGDSFKDLFNGMYRLWKEEKNFITNSINWYIEANTRPLKPDSSLIMTQTALELIYNWLIVENEKLIRGNDTFNISASNKIRLLLAKVSVSSKFHPNLHNLEDYAQKNNCPDAVEVIVRYRNSIVHSQKEKRKQALELSPQFKYEAVQLSLYYIEISMLFILGYTGQFYNRCSKRNEDTPYSR